LWCLPWTDSWTAPFHSSKNGVPFWGSNNENVLDFRKKANKLFANEVKQ